MASASGGAHIPTRRHIDGSFKEIVEEERLEIPQGLKFGDIIVEGSIADVQWWRKRGYKPSQFPDTYQVEPDVIIGTTNKVYIIEVKTTGAPIGRNHRLYHDLVNHLNDNGCKSEFLYLLSGGHQPDSDWNLIGTDRVLLWEDLFPAICETPLKVCLQGITMKNYCKL